MLLEGIVFVKDFSSQILFIKNAVTLKVLGKVKLKRFETEEELANQLSFSA